MSQKNMQVENDIARIASLYYDDHLTCPEIARLYGSISSVVIQRALKRHGYQLRHERHNSKYSVDIHTFDQIDSEGKAWALGFFAADGHVSKRGHLVFSQQPSQRDALEQFSAVCGSNAPMGDKLDGKSVSLCICSEALGRRLVDMGFNHKKSQGYDFEEVVSHVPSELLPHFLRGLFDGDGSIRYYKYPYHKKHTVHLGLTHTLPAVEFWADYFDSHTKLKRENDVVYTWCSTNRYLAEKIYFALYAEAEFFVRDKKQVFEEFLPIFHQEEMKT